MKTKKILISAMLAGIAMTAVVSCGDDDSKESLPPIGGYNSADEVGAADLAAYWSLDGDGIESKSNTAPTTSQGATYVDGVKGEAVNLNNGFLKYPSIASLTTGFQNFSISSWIKVTNNGASGSVFLSLSRPNEWAGNINFLSETGWMPATSDSITVKGQIVSNNALGWQDTRNATKVNEADALAGHVAFPNKIGGQWAHAVITWDGTARLFKTYVNGTKISNPKWEERGDSASPALEMNSPTYPVIGAFATTANGSPTDTWDKAMTGQLDEIRVWKKALTQADINALYELELAGR